jgi:hypothetical protein
VAIKIHGVSACLLRLFQVECGFTCKSIYRYEGEVAAIKDEGRDKES